MQGFVELPFTATVFVSVSVFVFVLVSVFVSEMNEAEVCGLAVHRNWLPYLHLQLLSLPVTKVVIENIHVVRNCIFTVPK